MRPTEELIIPDKLGWQIEPLPTGRRTITQKIGVNTQLVTASTGQSRNYDYPHIMAQLHQWPDCVLDGVIVALDKDGRPRKELVEGDWKKYGGSIEYVVNDLLLWGEETLTSLPLSIRLDRLRTNVAPLLSDGDPIKILTRFESGAPPKQCLTDSLKKGNDGISMRDRMAAYEAGRRSSKWIVVKNPLAAE
jgi:bifunctional non-homologous end joining protein LigD